MSGGVTTTSSGQPSQPSSQNKYTIHGSVHYRLKKLHEREETPEQTSAKRIRGIWGSRSFTDALIKCSERTWKVHRCVLAEASPVFFRMFQSECMEGNTATV